MPVRIRGSWYRLRPIRLEQYDSRKCMALRLLQSQRADFYMRQEMLCQTPQLSRAEAAARLGYPTFISHYYESGDKMGSIRVWSLLPGDDEYTRDVADLLLGVENLPRKITAQGSAVAQQPTSCGTRPLRPEANTLRRVPG